MKASARDITVLYLIRAIRAAGFGALGVLLAVYLPSFGLHPATLGAYLSLTVLTALALNAFLLARVDAIGRRRVLAFAAALYGVAGAALALAHGPALLVVAALTGALPPGGDGVFSMVEQAIIGNVDATERPAVFGRYGLVGSLAGSAGVLAAGVPALLAARSGLGLLGAERGAMVAYALLGVLALALTFTLGPAVEYAGDTRAPAEPRAPARSLGRSRRLLVSMAGLFSADAFGSAMVTTTLIGYWLHERYGLGPGALALVFFAARMAASVSYPIAIWLGRRIGLINTAVWTHIPSSLLLAALPLAGGVPGVAGLLVARGLLVEMDVPTRQAFISGAVDPEERAAAAGITTLGRQVGQLAGPAAGGLALALSAPALFALAAGVKIAYDLALWGLCRKVPEVATPREVGTAAGG